MEIKVIRDTVLEDYLRIELDRHNKALDVAMSYFQELDDFKVLSTQDFELPKQIASMARQEINQILGKEEVKNEI